MTIFGNVTTLPSGGCSLFECDKIRLLASGAFEFTRARIARCITTATLMNLREVREKITFCSLSFEEYLIFLVKFQILISKFFEKPNIESE